MNFKQRYNLAIEEAVVIPDNIDTSIGSAIESSEAEAELVEQQAELAQDQAAVEEAEAVVADLEQVVNDNEEMLNSKPEEITDNVVMMSQEAYYNAIGRLGYTTKDMTRVSLESTSSNIERLRLSTEGIKEVIQKIIEKLKAMFKKVIEWLKSIWNSIFNVEKNIIAACNELIKQYSALGNIEDPKDNIAIYNEYVPVHMRDNKGKPPTFEAFDTNYGAVTNITKMYEGVRAITLPKDDDPDNFLTRIKKAFDGTADNSGLAKAIWGSLNVNRDNIYINKRLENRLMHYIYSVGNKHVRIWYLTGTSDGDKVSIGNFGKKCIPNKDLVEDSNLPKEAKFDKNVAIKDLKYIVTRALPSKKLKGDIKKMVDYLTNTPLGLTAIYNAPDVGHNTQNAAHVIAKLSSLYRFLSIVIVPDVISDHMSNLKSWVKVYREILPGRNEDKKDK